MKITKEIIIEKIKEIAKQKGVSSLPKKVFISESGISEYEYLKLFNTWNEAVIAAGLEAQDFAKPYEKENLFENLKEVLEKAKVSVQELSLIKSQVSATIHIEDILVHGKKLL
jgi:hypothetical protein